MQFSDLALRPDIMRAIDKAEYQTPTPIQSKAIPKVLSGTDLLAAAQTGTGKTAGFTLPILELLSSMEGRSKVGKPRCLILTPTRELAAQIHESVKLYGQYLPLTSLVVFGGVSINPQITALQKPVDILIATPGRLLDLCGQGKLDLSALNILVLDEADRMLDMGFIHDIKRIIKLLPEKRQTLLFSATFSDEIRTLARKMLNNPEEVSVARNNTASELVDQTALYVDKNRKRALLTHIITTLEWNQVLVFTRTKHGADKLVKQLKQDEINALAIHGNKSQNARTRALKEFKQGALTVLVATDIAARGLDIDQLPNVVNFELPNVPEDYVHRIGRTGRAGMEGQAISLVNAEEVKLLKAIERLMKRDIEIVEIDGFTGHNQSADEIAANRADAQSKRGPRRRDTGQRTKQPKRQGHGKQAKAKPNQEEQGKERHTNSRQTNSNKSSSKQTNNNQQTNDEQRSGKQSSNNQSRNQSRNQAKPNNRTRNQSRSNSEARNHSKSSNTSESSQNNNAGRQQRSNTANTSAIPHDANGDVDGNSVLYVPKKDSNSGNRNHKRRGNNHSRAHSHNNRGSQNANQGTSRRRSNARRKPDGSAT